uniref:Uncharacterized protein n=1 Tax=Stomoxys calcitrans TaxID=35570 RepID=A0A1I8PYL5_STOCA
MRTTKERQKITFLRLISTPIVFLILWSVIEVESFNLSPKPNIIIKDPQLATYLPKYRASYFGYTLNLRKLGIIIGAPRAQSTLPHQRQINETGAIYRCTLNDPTNCSPYVFEERGNILLDKNATHYLSELREFQWMGASMDGGSRDSDRLIVCAPRLLSPSTNNYHMWGLCYWISDTLADSPINVMTVAELRSVDNQIRSYEDGERAYHYMIAEQGLSVHGTPDNREFVIGAPGISNWRGSVIRHRIVSGGNDIPNPKNFKQPIDSYLGYSVSSGYFDSTRPKRLMYVASAPQADLQSGEAYIFDYSGFKIVKSYVCRGYQFGEYFGYAVLAEDVNGDGLSDVIVSAPYYAIGESYEDGAIYIFINQGNFNFEKKLIISPVQGKGKFGTTLTKLGDINLDGFNDIAVGAPFDGNGTVFIYMGSKNGLSDQPSQRLHYPVISDSPYGSAMFGHGLSKGSDIDDNGYNDFAIGAPNAEAAFLYRSYPVVSIEATIVLQTREIKPRQSSFPVKVCYRIVTKSPKMKSQDISIVLLIDQQARRVRISSTNSGYEWTLRAAATRETKCETLNCEVRFNQAEVYKPIPLELSYKLVNNVPDSKDFCDDCAAIDPLASKTYSEKIIFNTGCASDVCVADLQLTSKLNHTYVVGSSSTFNITYEVGNRGEIAYLPQINIASSNRMPFAKVPSNCKHNKQEAIMLCDLNHGQPMLQGMTDSITIMYDVSSISGDSMQVRAKVVSTGKELSYGDNEVTDTIQLVQLAEIVASGESKKTNINLEDPSDTEFVNVYAITSNGPSTVEAMQVVMDIPVNYTIPGSGERVQIVDMNSIVMHAIYDMQMKDVNFFKNNTQIFISNPLASSEEDDHSETTPNSAPEMSLSYLRRRRDIDSGLDKDDRKDLAGNSTLDYVLGEDLKGSLPLNRTVVLNCNSTAKTQCIRA